ncbi:hypothetical protein RHMOL_Rhmol04G0115600 [Rhododendron molle]|uniref:Uncharacterized protein n=1 Tax=Rhododendron molle TaxID=49168 RepID=A0ACC0NZC3_RHOML|nr:hypothetical protein RHMOL_Rhmol04G0115600 [Rhododendron molle]
MVSSSTQSVLLVAEQDRLKYVHLPHNEAAVAELQAKSRGNFLLEYIKMNKQHPSLDSRLTFSSPPTPRSLALIMFHLETLSRDKNRDITELKDSDAELEIPGFVTRSQLSVPCGTRDPPVNNENEEEAMKIKRWLDDQPPSPVVFLCFGSMGSFEEDQLYTNEDLSFIAVEGDSTSPVGDWPPVLVVSAEDSTKGKNRASRRVPRPQSSATGRVHGTYDENWESDWVGLIGGDTLSQGGGRVRVALWVELDVRELVVRSADGYVA